MQNIWDCESKAKLLQNYVPTLIKSQFLNYLEITLCVKQPEKWLQKKI